MNNTNLFIQQRSIKCTIEELKYLFKTNNPSAIQLDAYIDAGGKDDWSSDDSNEFYVVAMAVIRDSHNWKIWKLKYTNLYNGNLHWGHRDTWEKFGGLDNRNEHFHTLIKEPPWEFAWIIAIPRSLFSSGISEMEKQMPHRFGGSTLSLMVYPITYLKYMKALIQSATRKKNDKIIRNVFYNNPSGGYDIQKLLIKELENDLRITPKFIKGDHPGIALADGLAWATRFHLKYGAKSNVFVETNSLPNRTCFAIGSDSTEMTYCNSISEFDEIINKLRLKTPNVIYRK